jgi:hypothetical protein
LSEPARRLLADQMPTEAAGTHSLGSFDGEFSFFRA